MIDFPFLNFLRKRYGSFSLCFDEYFFDVLPGSAYNLWMFIRLQFCNCYIKKTYVLHSADYKFFYPRDQSVVVKTVGQVFLLRKERNERRRMRMCHWHGPRNCFFAPVFFAVRIVCVICKTYFKLDRVDISQGYIVQSYRVELNEQTHLAQCKTTC